METFYVKCRIGHTVDRKQSVEVPQMMVSTESRHTWVPSNLLESIGVEREQKTVDFILSNGKCLTRHVGFAIVRWRQHFTVDEVVFCEKDDLPLLGTRSLDGLNLIVDLPQNKLVSTG